MKVFKKFSAIIILGRPGSGKDTQANLLADRFGLIHIISSKMIEETLKTPKKTVKLENKLYDIERERHHLRSGALVNLNFVAALVKDKIKKVARQGKGFITSGSLRSLTEMKTDLPLIESLYGRDNMYIFHIKISPEEVYVRNLKRHRKDLPELDTKKIIEKRLRTFNKYTWPVIKLLKKQKRIIDINGEQKVMSIHRDIMAALNKTWLSQSKAKKK